MLTRLTGDGSRARQLLMLVLALVLALGLALLATGCSSSTSDDSSATTDEDVETYTIGVAVYDSTDPEMSMFYHYYTDYIAESFPVEFLMSSDLASYEDEVEFIDTIKEEGGTAIIAFYVTDLESTVEYCAEQGIYLVLGSSSISDDEYEAVKDNEYFLGVIGPDSDEEYAAGYEMAQSFAEDGATSYVIASGGSATSNGYNYMHFMRTCGMLQALQDELGLTYEDTVENLATVDDVTEISTGVDGVTIVITPGYFATDSGYANVESVLADGDFDAFLSAFSVDDISSLLKSEIASSETEMLVGIIDCFSDENYTLVETTDANGNSLINYVKGKFASMVAPAFVAAFNASTGNVDVVKPDGVAFRIYQTYWTAEDEAEYAELYGYTRGIYENAISSSDIMNVLYLYNEDASYDDFEELATSCDEESVRARLGE